MTNIDLYSKFIARQSKSSVFRSRQNVSESQSSNTILQRYPVESHTHMYVDNGPREEETHIIRGRPHNENDFEPFDRVSDGVAKSLGVSHSSIQAEMADKRDYHMPVQNSEIKAHEELHERPQAPRVVVHDSLDSYVNYHVNKETARLRKELKRDQDFASSIKYGQENNPYKGFGK